MTRWRRWLVEAAALVALVSMVRCYQTRDLVTGKLPFTELVASDGSRLALVGRGPTMVHVFATWCGVCQLEESNVQRVARSGRVIAIASRSGTAAAVHAYMKERELVHPVVLDVRGELAQKLGVHAFPTTFFVNDQGEIITREVGYTTSLGLRARLWLASW